MLYARRTRLRRSFGSCCPAFEVRTRPACYATCSGMRTVSRKAGIGQITPVAAQDVIGHAAADTVKLDPLPDQASAGQGAVCVEGENLGGQHLPSQPDRLRPGAVGWVRTPHPTRNLACRVFSWVQLARNGVFVLVLVLGLDLIRLAQEGVQILDGDHRLSPVEIVG